MILINFFIAFFAIFIAPQLILYYYTTLRFSLILVYGFIASLTVVWFGLLISFYLKIPNIILISIIWLIMFIEWYHILKVKTINRKKQTQIVIKSLIIAFLLLAPVIIHYGGTIFWGWDALASWNRWAIELYDNKYLPIDAAYPLLVPALLGFFYKLQGSVDVWWSAKLLLFILPFITLSSTIALYYEKRDNTYLWFALLLYPYLLSSTLYSGYVDMPAMVIGTLVLIMLYAAQTEKNKELATKYLLAAIFLSGLASITKQAGIAFLLFTLIYIIIHHKNYTDKNSIYKAVLFSLLYFGTFLILYMQHTNHGIIENAGYLHYLSKKKKLMASNHLEYYHYLWKTYFSYPQALPIIKSLIKPLGPITITPVLILLAYMLFFYKSLRNYKGVGFLSAIFFILGTIVWIEFFSYSERNSFWIRSFFIIFAGINFSYFTTYYKSLFSSRKFFFALFLVALSYLAILGNSFAITQQQKYQSQIGNPQTAQLIANILSHSKKCTKIYTTEQTIRFNTILFNFRDRTVPLFDVRQFKTHLEHNCSTGIYFLFRKASILDDDWNYVKKLVKYNILKIVPTKQNLLLYRVDANTTIPKILIDYKSSVVDLIKGIITNDVLDNIDKIKIYDNGLVVTGWGIIKGTSIDNTKKYLVLKGIKKSFIIETTSIKRADITKALHAKDLSNAGFKAKIFFEDFPKGNYKLNLLLVDPKDNSWHIKELKKSLKI